MRVSFVSMPWQSLDMPSLQVGLLRTLVTTTRPADTVTEYHGWLHWAEFLLDRSAGALSPTDYMSVANDQIFDGFGDWVFSGVLYDDPDWGTEQLIRYAGKTGTPIDTVLGMRPHAADFIDAAAEEILRSSPDVVGMTTTFLQNVPSLALAKELKRRRPGVLTVLGGSNCDGPMGHALHRNHRFVDYVVRGEAEGALPDLLARIEEGARPADVPGLCWWDGDVSRCNEETRRTVSPGVIPTPNYDAWQSTMDASPVAEFVEPKIVVEGARGCWWGEKHHCTFCGLNGSLMEFRAKSGHRLWSEIDRLVRRHQILDVVTVDNIMSMGYFRDFLPLAAESGWDLRIHYEVKSNLSGEQVASLARAGVHHVQPGIESLNSRVLALMDKGVSGCHNVRMLRECENHGLTCTWNYLYGFPGERDADYKPVIEQMPALWHLQPPGGATRIALERFSPHYTNPALGFPDRRPADMYQHVYQLPADELNDLVYLFDSPPAGIHGDVENRLIDAVERWTAAYSSSSLLLEASAKGDELDVHEGRHGRPRCTYRLSGWEAVAFRHLEHGRTLSGLRRRMADGGTDLSTGALGAWVDMLAERGLVFRDKNTVVALPTEAVALRAPERDDAPMAEAAAGQGTR
ncbi:RiPP maturation radical SAM C-methyltransferase [Streptomyces cheonanensis]|uniref:RiPP maturation radical SAM C-methyltransferase n=1 Tax=Streptomyces cheonanensis TaxID=312720 RepID=A0ABN2V5X0_9ACTN|nr:RiPP maturation radical SAM C-methyltransferase [Streptomyces sp. AA0539]